MARCRLRGQQLAPKDQRHLNLLHIGMRRWRASTNSFLPVKNRTTCPTGHPSLSPPRNPVPLRTGSHALPKSPRRRGRGQRLLHADHRPLTAGPHSLSSGSRLSGSHEPRAPGASSSAEIAKAIPSRAPRDERTADPRRPRPHTAVAHPGHLTPIRRLTAAAAGIKARLTPVALASFALLPSAPLVVGVAEERR